MLLVPAIMTSQVVEGAFNCEFCGRPAGRAILLQGLQYYSCTEHIAFLERMMEPEMEKDAKDPNS